MGDPVICLGCGGVVDQGAGIPAGATGCSCPPPSVEVTAIRDRLVELNQDINWIPSHVRDGQFGTMSALVGNKITGVPLEKAIGELKTVSKDWLELMEVLF